MRTISTVSYPCLYTPEYWIQARISDMLGTAWDACDNYHFYQMFWSNRSIYIGVLYSYGFSQSVSTCFAEMKISDCTCGRESGVLSSTSLILEVDPCGLLLRGKIRVTWRQRASPIVWSRDPVILLLSIQCNDVNRPRLGAYWQDSVSVRPLFYQFVK